MANESVAGWQDVYDEKKYPEDEPGFDAMGALRTIFGRQGVRHYLHMEIYGLWKARFGVGRRTMSFQYRHPAASGEPSLDDLLAYCSLAARIEGMGSLYRRYKAWCDAFGVDSRDSRAGWHYANACKVARKLRRFLPAEDYRLFSSAGRKLKTRLHWA